MADLTRTIIEALACLLVSLVMATGAIGAVWAMLAHTNGHRAEQRQRKAIETWLVRVNRADRAMKELMKAEMWRCRQRGFIQDWTRKGEVK